MDFRELNYVIAISEQGTISKAAEVLHIAQPSLSKFLQNLETSLGVSLFERVSRHMNLTDAGEGYVRTAYQIRALGNQLQNSMNDRAKLRMGHLSIASTPARGKYVMVHCVPEFKRLYPGFRLSVSEKTVDDIENDLRNGVADLAMYIVTQRREEFIYDHICTEEIVLAMSPDNPHAREGEQRQGLKRLWFDIRRLKDQVFLIPPEIWLASRTGGRLLRENGMSPEIIRLGSTETCVSVVSRGIGVCFCSSMMETGFEGKKELLYFSVGEPVAEVEFVIARRPSMPVTRAVRDFTAIVRSVFGDGKAEREKGKERGA